MTTISTSSSGIKKEGLGTNYGGGGARYREYGILKWFLGCLGGGNGVCWKEGGEIFMVKTGTKQACDGQFDLGIE